MTRIRHAAAILWQFRYHVLCSLVALALWDTFLIKPFRLFVVTVHEVCHAGAALLTGGEVVEMRTAADESGHTLARGGVFAVISAAGYVGSAFLGSLLIYTGKLPLLQRLVLLLIGGTTMGMTMRYTPVGAPDFYLGLFGGLVFTFMAIKSQPATAAGSIWLGVMLCLYSLDDFRTDLWLYPEQTDAGILANHWGHRLLAYPIALSWVLVSLWMMYRSMRALVGKEGGRRKP